MSVYSLTGVVVNIETGQPSRGNHLVAVANGKPFTILRYDDSYLELTHYLVAHSAPVAPNESQWYLLNDFHIKPVTTEEALTFNTSWKMPSVITYQRKEANNRLDATWKENLDSSLLYVDLR